MLAFPTYWTLPDEPRHTPEEADMDRADLADRENQEAADREAGMSGYGEMLKNLAADLARRERVG